MEFSEVEARVLRYLEQRFLAGGVLRAVSPENISRDNGIEQIESLRLVARLKLLGVLETISDDGDCWIDDAICQRVAELEKGRTYPQNAPATININIANIGQLFNSQLQQGTVESTQTLYHEDVERRKADVFFDVSVLNEPPKFWQHGDDTILRYNLERTDSSIRIQPTMGYLSRCEAGGPIGPLNYSTGNRSPFCWDFPTLDFKILNNSPNLLYLNELILNVEESVLDPFQIIAVRDDVYGNFVGHFLLLNEGWSDLHDVTVRFAMMPGEAEVMPSVKEYPFVCHVGTLSQSEKVWTLDAFRQAGVDTRGLELLSNAEVLDDKHLNIADENGIVTTISEIEYERRYQECLGPFKDGVGTAIGEIDFTVTTVAGTTKKHTVAFWTPVYAVNMNRRGVLAPSSYQCQAQFEVGMSGYQRTVSLPLKVESGNTDRFTAQIAVTKSSRHRFRATIRDIQGNHFQFPMIEMTVFVPRSSEARVSNSLSKKP